MQKTQITKINDAYGQQIWDYFQGEEIVEIVERNDGYIHAGRYGSKSYFFKYDKWSPVEKKVIRFARGRVLDIGCGAGRHALHLQEKGLDVTAIDNSPLAIKVVKKRGVKKARILSFEQIGTSKPRKFNTILMLGNNFGLFGGFKKARRMLKVLYNITAPNALILATTMDPYNTDSVEHKEYHKLNLKRGRAGGQIRMRIRHKKLRSPWFDYLFVSKAEMEEILAESKWRVAKYIDAKNSSSYAVVLEKI